MLRQTEPLGRHFSTCWAACRLCSELQASRFCKLSLRLGWDFGDTVSHFCLHNQPLTHTLLHKPNRVHWFTKLDLGGILAFLCCEFLLWMEETYSGLPRNSVTCHLCACVWRYVNVYVCWCVKRHMYVQMYTYEAIYGRAVNNLRCFFSRVNTF